MIRLYSSINSFTQGVLNTFWGKFGCLFGEIQPNFPQNVFKTPFVCLVCRDEIAKISLRFWPIVLECLFINRFCKGFGKVN